MRFAPVLHGFQNGHEAVAQTGQGVLHARRDLRKDVTVNPAVLLQLLKLPGERGLGDGGADAPLQFAKALHAVGMDVPDDGLTIGVETGDDQALAFMDKGYTAADIVRQCRRLDAAGIGYHFFYLTGVSGAGRGEVGAIASAQVFNQTHPRIIGASMLTIFPESRLYQEIRQGNWREAGELEKIAELKTLIAHLEIPADFATLGASNAIWICGRLPEDRERMLNALEQSACEMGEAQLREYRESLRHL